MVVKRGYKLTEIGVVPSDWEIFRLGTLFKFQNGVNADKNSYGYGIPFINVLEVITDPHIRAAKIPGRVNLIQPEIENFLVRRGDIVFNRTSETQEEVGLGSVYIDKEPVVFGGFVIRGRPLADSIDVQFSGYMLRAPAIRTQIVSKGQGAVRANIGQADLRQVLIPVPPLYEQEAIAEVLTDIDAQIAALDMLIAKKRNIKQGMMHDLLTGRRRLSGFSGEWKEYVYGDIFIFLPTANNPRSELSMYGAVSYIHYGDIHKKWAGFLDCSQAELPTIDQRKIKTIPMLQEGDLLVADASEDYDGLGASIEVKNVGTRNIVGGLHTMLLRGNSNILANGFRSYLQHIPNTKKQVIEAGTGVSVYGLSKAKLQDVRVELPTIEEQRAIVNILADIDMEITALEAQRRKKADLKQAIMYELITGKTRLI